MSCGLTVRELGKDEFDAWDGLVDKSDQGSIFCTTLWLKASNLPFTVPFWNTRHPGMASSQQRNTRP